MSKFSIAPGSLPPCSPHPLTQPQPPTPNPDRDSDLGYHQLHAPPLHVNAEIQSPTLAQFARDGVTLSSYYSYKYCGPSRASLLTGRLPGHGVSEMMWSPAQPGGYNANLTMLPAKLRDVGYTTVGIGKW